MTDRYTEGEKTDYAVEVEHIEGKEVDFDGNVLRLDVLPLPPAQFLEGKKTILLRTPSDSLCINDKRLDALLDALFTHSSVRSRI